MTGVQSVCRYFKAKNMQKNMQMNNDAKIAKEILDSQKFTCVMCKGDMIATSTERGVAPLLKLIDSGVTLAGFCAADKVVGKSAAMLYKLLEIDFLYANIISRAAATFLENEKIDFAYNEKVDFIRNRTDDGFCPLEQAVLDVSDCTEALEAMRKKLFELKGDVL